MSQTIFPLDQTIAGRLLNIASARLPQNIIRPNKAIAAMKACFMPIHDWHLMQGMEQAAIHLDSDKAQEDYLKILAQWPDEKDLSIEWMLQVSESVLSGALAWSKNQLEGEKTLEDWAEEVLETSRKYQW